MKSNPDKSKHLETATVKVGWSHILSTVFIFMKQSNISCIVYFVVV